MQSIETPFPIEGSIHIENENVRGASLGVVSEWVSEHERGNVLKKAWNRLERHHGTGVEADVVFYEDGTFELDNFRDYEGRDA